MNRRHSRVAIALTALTVACGGSPSTPTPLPGPPAIACPADVTVNGVLGGAQAVDFAAPATTAGAAPVTVTCAPASGSVFSIGGTPVACTAVDALGRQSRCSFTITLTAAASSVTKFLAFGDSLTEGENGRRPFTGFINPADTYPARLQLLLSAAYPGQSITVVNRGSSGEFAEQGADRLADELRRDRPGALLLLHGYNDLLNGCPERNLSVARCAEAVAEVVEKVQEMIRTARKPEFGVRDVFVSTLTPPGPYVPPGMDGRIARQAIVDTNRHLSALVRSEGVILVDSYPLFIGHEADYVDNDGLHLRPAGFQVLAESFFAAITTAVATTGGFR